ncbi:MAG: hypothetical protein ACE5JL_07890, partial [Dehalococcoidia bacterium]
MDNSTVLEGLRHVPEYDDQIVHLEKIPPRPARYADPGSDFHPVLQEALEKLGLLPLYSHQIGAITALRVGADVMIA